MTSRVSLVWLAFLAILLSGCDSAEDLVNRRLPSVPVEQHRAAAIKAAQAALTGLNDANAGFNIRIEDIAAAVTASSFTEKLGVGQLKIRGDRQLILAEADVVKTFSRDDFPEFDENTKKLIETLKPEIKGKITLGLGLTSANALSEDGRITIGLRLAPLFRNVEVERVTVAGKLDVDVLVTLMNRLADKVSGELSRAEFASISFPAIPFKRTDLSRSIAFETTGGVNDKVAISAGPVSPSVYLRSVAWLIEGGNVTFLAELAPVGSSPASGATASGNGDYAQLKTEFAGKLTEGLGLADPLSANWIAVGNRLIAGLVNAAFEQGQPCLGAKASLAERSFGNKIEIPQATIFDCTPKTECAPARDCDAARVCEQAEDCEQARDCQVCALGACFNDPACEREKAGATYDCEVRKAERKLECERLKAPAVAACESKKAAEEASCDASKSSKLACDAGKQDLDKLAGTGNIAEIAGRIGGSANISVCVKQFSVAPSLESFAASAIVRGEGAVDLGIKYVPRQIARYFSCPFPWAEGKHIKIAIPEQPAKLDATLVLETSASSAMLKAKIKTSALAIPMRPAARDLLLGNYDMRAICAPVAPMLHPATLDVTSSVPEVDGIFSLPGDEGTLVLTLEPTTFDIAGKNAVANGAYVPNAKALLLSADQSTVPAN